MKKYRGVFLKNDNELALMKQANQIVRQILEAMGRAIEPGRPTMHFEDIAQELCKKHDVRPAFQGYGGFPYALCCSVNEEVVHGFPSKKRILREGDIVSFDMGVVVEGFHGDAARTYPVGRISEQAERLLRVTAESLELGAAAAKPGNNLKDVSAAVQKHAEANGMGIVKRFVGHGIGLRLHEKPEIPNFVGLNSPDLPLQPGMVLAIEPMLTLGADDVDILEDEWTAVTRDRSLAAHFEHSVAVTPRGPQILDS
ncbi:MAG: type I methionyl aminopeptidase [Deltaproteobacteria bacterium]|jgi:methionyl aminopeptidase|nr:type I methionyl aminopeptidase [Deltaproteobacteria bacterium]